MYHAAYSDITKGTVCFSTNCLKIVANQRSGRRTFVICWVVCWQAADSPYWLQTLEKLILHHMGTLVIPHQIAPWIRSTMQCHKLHFISSDAMSDNNNSTLLLIGLLITSFGSTIFHVFPLWFSGLSFYSRVAENCEDVAHFNEVSVFISCHSLNKGGISNHLFTFIRSGNPPPGAAAFGRRNPAARSIFTESLREWRPSFVSSNHD